MIERLADTLLLRTDQHGTVRLSSDGHTLWVQTEQGATRCVSTDGRTLWDSQVLAVRLLGSLVAHDLDDDLTVARAIVEVYEDHLLPRPKRHAPPNKWNGE